jgi:hypothetical protein
MSYDIGLYHPSVRARVEAGEELDEFEHPLLDAGAVSKFIETLIEYGYESEPSSPDCRAFAKDVNGTPIEVHVFSTEIGISVPYGGNSEDAVFEALQDASEIAEPRHMALFNPQTGEWADL